MLYESTKLHLAAEYGIATLTLLRPIDAGALVELESALDILHARPELDVLVLTGDGSPVDGPADAARGQRVARRLANLPTTTLAMMDGPWYGGALELALACDYRAAIGSARTRFGFPQLRAGRVPCWGGTVRLTRRIGLRRSLRLLLSGRKVSAGQALAMGLVDYAFGPRLAAVGRDRLVFELQRAGTKVPCRRRWRDCLPWRREAILSHAERRLREGVSIDHRAAWETFAAVAAGIRNGKAEGLSAERRAALVKPVFVSSPEIDISNVVAPATPCHVGIVGCGTIGASLATWLSVRGCTVTIRDRDPSAAQVRIEANFRDAIQRRLLHGDDASARMAAITWTRAWAGFAKADVVIEAVDESKRLKRTVLKELERVVGPDAILATTSTGHTVRGLQKSLSRPGQLVGLHVGCPAASLKVVELSAGPQTDAGAVAKLRDLLASLGKTPVVVADRPGRVLGRVMLPYLHEAILAAEEGVPVEALDAVVRRFGMAWGPFQAIDAIGVDVVQASLVRLSKAFGRTLTPPPLLDRLVESGHRGRKTGSGFYKYGKRSQPNRPALPKPRNCDVRAIGQRVITRLLTSAQAALREGATRDLATLNALLIDAGWPAFRGGPLVPVVRGAA